MGFGKDDERRIVSSYLSQSLWDVENQGDEAESELDVRVLDTRSHDFFNTHLLSFLLICLPTFLSHTRWF